MRYEVTIKLRANEWIGLYKYLHTKQLFIDELVSYQDFRYMTPNQLVMYEYSTKLTVNKFEVWSNRKSNKLYNYSLPASVALCLYKDMQLNRLTHDQQDFLSSLDERLKSKGFFIYETVHVDGKNGWEDIHDE